MNIKQVEVAKGVNTCTLHCLPPSLPPFLCLPDLTPSLSQVVRQAAG